MTVCIDLPVNFMECRKMICTACGYYTLGKLCLMKAVFEEEVFN